jgi:hypothetical protein
MAAGYEAQHAAMTRLNRLTDELLKTIAWFAAGWALATAAAFSYIYLVVRRRKTEEAATR